MRPLGTALALGWAGLGFIYFLLFSKVYEINENSNGSTIYVKKFSASTKTILKFKKLEKESPLLSKTGGSRRRQ